MNVSEGRLCVFIHNIISTVLYSWKKSFHRYGFFQQISPPSLITHFFESLDFSQSKLSKYVIILFHFTQCLIFFSQPLSLLCCTSFCILYSLLLLNSLAFNVLLTLGWFLLPLCGQLFFCYPFKFIHVQLVQLTIGLMVRWWRIDVSKRRWVWENEKWIKYTVDIP